VGLAGEELLVERRDLVGRLRRDEGLEVGLDLGFALRLLDRRQERVGVDAEEPEDAAVHRAVVVVLAVRAGGRGDPLVDRAR